jgi:hypothetical protein
MRGRILGHVYLPHNEPRQIFLQAEQFHNARNLLGRFVTHYDRPVSFPSLVCSAFALELYLKCLIAINGNGIPTTHNLRTLFKRLTMGCQENIRSYFATKTPEMTKYFAEVNRQAGYPIMPLTPDFDAQLRASADAFQNMRYVYERREATDQPRGYFAYFIEDGARHTILQIRPEWEGRRSTFTLEPRSTSPTR